MTCYGPRHAWWHWTVRVWVELSARNSWLHRCHRYVTGKLRVPRWQQAKESAKEHWRCPLALPFASKKMHKRFSLGPWPILVDWCNGVFRQLGIESELCGPDWLKCTRVHVKGQKTILDAFHKAPVSSLLPVLPRPWQWWLITAILIMTINWSDHFIVMMLTFKVWRAPCT